MKVSESRALVSEAKHVQIMCPHVTCAAVMDIQLEWPYTSEDKQRKISEAIEEHRRLCRGAPPEAQRVYTISYPRA
jgi:hypothetical protein